MNEPWLGAVTLGLTWGWLLRWRQRGRWSRPGSSASLIAGTLLLGAEVGVFLGVTGAGAFIGFTLAGAIVCHAWLAGLARRRDLGDRPMPVSGSGR